MQFSLLTLATVLGLSLAAPSNPGFVHVPLSIPKRDSSNSLNNPSKAPGYFNVDLLNEVLAYEGAIEVGGQEIKTIMDTGSSFLWVWDSNATYCSTDNMGIILCSLNGDYTPGKSKTSNNTGKSFHIQYGLGSASGDMYTDVVSLGGASVKNFHFGVNSGEFANNTIPVFGIGPNPDNQTSFSAQLVEQGQIKRNAYGLSLGPVDDSEKSELTFGAVNTGRFEGKLKTLNIDNDPYHYRVKASGSLNGDSFLKDGDVILDSGTSITYLNSEAWPKFEATLKKSGIELGSRNGFNTIPCADGNKLKVELNFDGQIIKVSGEDLSLSLKNIGVMDDTTCILGVLPGGINLQEMNLFGDTMVRSIYAVYDLDHNQVSLAQAVHGKPDNYVVIDGAIPHSE